MYLEYYSSEILKKQIKDIIKDYLDLDSCKIFFFGSRVRGDHSEKSDIDVGVEGEKEISSKSKLDIEERLEKIPTLYKINFVDFNKVSDDFKKEALKNIEKI